MTFLIVTHVPHLYFNGAYHAYGPYIREMNLWIRNADKVVIVAPLERESVPNAIDLPYHHDNIVFLTVHPFNILDTKSVFTTILKIPGILLTTFRAMRHADHIHLRCPGNMGLIGLMIQCLFPGKKKTVKYAGNWENYPAEHVSYRLQKKIAKSTFFSKKMQVLIYGEWPNFTKNCLPFFTASYKEADRLPVNPRSMNDKEIRLAFLGTLDERKRPEYAIEAVYMLIKKGYANITLDIVGMGPFETICREKIIEFGLEDKVKLHGNIPPAEVSRFLNNAHLLIFLSRMEGWPKVVAESMWWGCVPVTTAVSCVPWMLDYGKRGIITDRNPQAAADAIVTLLNHPGKYKAMQSQAVSWAREYTLERFDREIKKLI